MKIWTEARKAFLILAVFLFANPALSAAENAEPTSDSGITDAQILETLQRVARHQYHPLSDGEYPIVTNLAAARAARAPAGIAWNGPWGTTLYGLARLGEVTGDAEATQFALEHNRITARYHQWLGRVQSSTRIPWPILATNLPIIALGDLFQSGDLVSCSSMGAQFLDGVLSHRAQATNGQASVAARAGDWIVNKHERLPDRTLWQSNLLGGIVCAEDLGAVSPFLVRMAAFGRKPQHLFDAADQIIHQAAREQDTDGLWFHAYHVPEKKTVPFKWGRANGAALLATVETLTALKAEDPDRRAKLIAILGRQVEALKPLQAPSGLWRQVLDQTNSWEETSGTALITYGLARAARQGWIDATNLVIARHAFAGLSQQVTPNGVIRGVCESTDPGPDLAYYLHRRHPDDDPHGPGPLLLAGAELLAVPKK